MSAGDFNITMVGETLNLSATDVNTMLDNLENAITEDPTAWNVFIQTLTDVCGQDINEETDIEQYIETHMKHKRDVLLHLWNIHHWRPSPDGESVQIVPSPNGRTTPVNI